MEVQTHCKHSLPPTNVDQQHSHRADPKRDGCGKRFRGPSACSVGCLGVKIRTKEMKDSSKLR